MPTYSISGPDGKTYSIEGPEGATREQVIAKIKERNPNLGQDTAAPQRGVMDKLLGLTGPRYQTFPERIVRAPFEAVQAGAEVTKGAVEGKYGPTGEGIKDDPRVYQAASLGVSAAPGAAEGVGAAVAAGERRAAEKASLPTKAEYRGYAKEAYKQIEKEKVTLPPESIETFTADARGQLDAKLFTEVGSPSTFKAVSQIEQSGGSLAKIMDVYSALGEIPKTAGSDFAAAQIVRNAIDQQMENTFVGTMWDSARASWRTFSQLDQIDKLVAAGERRAASTGTGANTETALRQNVRKIIDSDERSRGFSKEAKDQLENIVMGSWVTNSARYIGKFAPSGPVSLGSTLAAGLTGLASGGLETGAVAAAAVAIPTTVAKYLSRYLTYRQIQQLEEIIRAEAPQGQAAMKAARERPPSPDAQSLQAGVNPLVPGAASGLLNPGQNRPPLAEREQSL